MRYVARICAVLWIMLCCLFIFASVWLYAAAGIYLAPEWAEAGRVTSVLFGFAAGLLGFCGIPIALGD